VVARRSRRTSGTIIYYSPVVVHESDGHGRQCVTVIEDRPNVMKIVWKKL